MRYAANSHMDFKQFELEMTSLQKFRQDNEKYCNALSQIYNASITVDHIGEYIDARIREIEKATNDKNEWISWYVYETNFGQNHPFIMINESRINVSKLKDFYNICLERIHES